MSGMRKKNQSDPKRKERALRLFLLQTRRLEAWSDGNRLVEGRELHELRAGVLHRLISLRGGAPDRAEAENGRVWRNYQSLCRMRARSDKTPVKLTDRMIEDLKLSATGQDPGSGDRKRFLRRALRKVSPAVFEELPLRVRCGDPEADRVRGALSRRPLMIRRDLTINGFFVPAGTPAQMRGDGRARLDVPGLEGFPAEGLRPSDLKRKRPRTQKAAGPELEF
jgi:hypothetical protein